MDEMEPKRWWQKEFKGNIRIMTMEIAFAFLVALGIANLIQNKKYSFLLVPIIFIAVLAIILRLTRKGDRSRVN